MTSKAKESDTLVLMRQVYTQSDIDEKYMDQSEPNTAFDAIKESCRCSPKCVGRHLLGFVPFVKVMRHYQWRQWIVIDMLSGISSGFLHMPMGLAFGILAALRPVNGLYTSFFPVVVYMIFGTSPHVSMGTNAVIALLTANVVNRETTLHLSSLGSNKTLTEDDIAIYKEDISIAICFIGGLILLGMGVLKLGFITNYLSKSFISGFNFAAAVHIATSQIVKILNLKIPPRSGAANLVKTYIDIFANITKSNPADVIIGLICVAILLGVKIGVNERFRHKMKVPIPIELILVIVCTIISHFTRLQYYFNIATVGKVPTGMPAPRLPPLEVFPQVATDAFVLGILCFALTISLGKLCAKLHSYDIDDNQELVAYGLCNFVGAFFGNFPSCIAPPRTMLVSSMGAKSTLNNLPSAVFVLLVLLVIGNLFQSLPIAMLAAMITVAMKDLLLQVRDLPSMWRVNKLDFLTWVVTALASLLVDLDIGLLVGVSFSILTVLIVSQLATVTSLGRSELEDILLPTGRKDIKTIPGIKIFRFESQLHFASAERFKSQLFAAVFDPTKRKQKKLEKRVASESAIPLSDDVLEMDSTDVHHIILDCSGMTYVDLAGIDCLLMVSGQFSRADVVVFLAAVPASTLATLQRAGALDKIGRNHFFYNMFDALHRACEPQIVASRL